MKRLSYLVYAILVQVIILLWLMPCAHAQQLQMYCNHASAVPCTTASPGTSTGAWDPAWLDMGKANSMFNQWYGVTGLVKSNGPSASPTAAASGDIFSVLALPNLSIRMPTSTTPNAGTLTFIGSNAGKNNDASIHFDTFIGDGAGGAGNFNGDLQGGGTGLTSAALEDTCTGSGCQTQLTSGNFNTCVGTSCIGHETDGNGNSALGVDALRNTLHSSNNTAIGVHACRNGATIIGNICIGFGVLEGNDGWPSSVTGDANTVVGTAAMSGTGYTTASDNSVLGNTAFAAATTGSNNVAVGFEAMQLSTTATDNVAVGYQALVSDLTGTNNVAVGRQALATSTVSGNTAVGYQALELAGTATNVTAVGHQALVGDTTGSGNTAVGDVALFAVTTGANNVAIGWGAGQALTTNSANTFVGAGAGGAATAASVTAIGQNAGDKITSGGSNTVIGTQVASTTLTTGSGNVLIGTSSATDAYAAATTSELNINNAVRGGINSLSTGDIGSCGTSPSITSTATEMAGTFTTGTGATQCFIQFHHANSHPATCIVSARSGTQPAYVTTDDGSSATLFLTTAAASATYDYWCPVH